MKERAGEQHNRSKQLASHKQKVTVSRAILNGLQCYFRQMQNLIQLAVNFRIKRTMHKIQLGEKGPAQGE